MRELLNDSSGTPDGNTLGRLQTMMVVLVVAVPAIAQNTPQLTTADIKRFIDPTEMQNSLTYSFQVDSLSGISSTYTHSLEAMVAFHRRVSIAASIPVQTSSLTGQPRQSGIGDVAFIGGAVVHENVTSRFTNVAVGLGVLAPTGSVEKGTGGGTWVLSPITFVALNPTDRFPVYIQAGYSHSLGSLRDPDCGVELSCESGPKVRTIELGVEPYIILPKGFYAGAFPRFQFDLEQHFNSFALGFGIGHALTRSLGIQGRYLRHIAGTKAYDQELAIELSYIFGAPKD